MTIAETDTPLTELTTHDILRRTKELLSVNGWCKLQYEDKDGRMCIAGAINRAQCGTVPISAFVAISNAIGTDWVNISMWNDAPATTFEDVIGALDQAIKNTTPKDEINGVTA